MVTQTTCDGVVAGTIGSSNRNSAHGMGVDIVHMLSGERRMAVSQKQVGSVWKNAVRIDNAPYLWYYLSNIKWGILWLKNRG